MLAAAYGIDGLCTTLPCVAAPYERSDLGLTDSGETDVNSVSTDCCLEVVNCLGGTHTAVEKCKAICLCYATSLLPRPPVALQCFAGGSALLRGE